MYNSNNIANRIKLIAQRKGISNKKILEDVGLGLNTFANMKTSMPKADNLAKIAEYLNVSVDYLLGRTDTPDLVSLPIDDEICNLYNQLNKTGKKKLLDYAKDLFEISKYTN